jgi:hypothetical protein
VKLPRVVNGQRLITPTDEGKICGFVIAPRETVLYSSDGLIVFGLAGLALGFTFNLFPALWVYLYDQTWFTAIVDPHGRDSQELLLAWLILIWAATFAWRLRTAYRYYLSFEDPLATVLASQVIVLLAAAIAFVNRWV